ncbi:MAG TPA: NfeD family protein [bacterium]|nr:NfeD family protein [bacterium]
MTWWIWMVLGLGLAAVEILTPGGFFVIFFGVAAIVVGALSGLGLAGPPWFQWLLFSVLAIVSLLFFREPLLRKIERSQRKEPVDMLEGEIAVAQEEIAVGSIGKVELRGSSWSARNESERAIHKSERCRVHKVEGLTLGVRPEGVRE